MYQSSNSLRKYYRTDMAAELYRTIENQKAVKEDALSDSGILYTTADEGGIQTEKLVISNENASKQLGKSIGTYYTIHTGDLRLLSSEEYDCCHRALRAALSDAVENLLPDYRMPVAHPHDQYQTDIDAPGVLAEDHTSVSPEWDQGAQQVHTVPPAPLPQDPQPFRPLSFLVVGLGNPELTPDALGPMCVRSLNVTRHLTDSNVLPPALAKAMHNLSAVTPMVLGQTGIETLELVRGAVDVVNPDMVILLDALAASEIASLARTIQISTTGIHPGGGVGNKRQPLDAETLGVPVMTIGVPTVIAASTLIYRALEAAGILPSEEEEQAMPLTQILHETLSSVDTGCVAPKDIDAGVREFSRLIALSVNEIALGEETAAEWFRRI